jgi:glycosyltransferase involved in cell wall biosynthesis
VTQFQGPWAGEGAAEGAGWVSTRAKWLLEQAAYRRCDAFITLSQAFADLLARDYGIAPGTITVVPAAVDVDRFKPAPSRAALRDSLAMGSGPSLFTMRRLVQRMGLEVLIDGFALLHARLPAAQLRIAGAGPLREALEARIQAAGLEGAVQLLGRVSDELAIALYQASDLTIVPTLALEGFGLVTVESLACGTPVVGTTAGATPEILGPFDGRLLVAPGDAVQLADRLIELLTGPDPLRTSQACRAHVLDRYTWPTALDRLEAILDPTGAMTHP